MGELVVIALLGIVGWFWYGSIRAKEIAVIGAKMRCESRGLLLLDQTVVLSKIRLRRDHGGQVRLERKYQFEFSSDGDDRYEGMIILYANRITDSHINYPPQRP